MRKPKNKNTKKYKKWRTRVDYRNALKEWSKLVQQRDNSCCAICGEIKNIQSHHILDKRYYKEYSLNVGIGVTLCVRCHKWGKFAAHTNSIWFVAWLQENRPEQYQLCLDLVRKDCTC
jgi:hypothetical protein